MIPSDYFDFCVFLFLVFCSLWGFIRGFISTLTYLFASVIGIMVASRYKVALMDSFGWSDASMEWLAWIILFAIVSLIVCCVTSWVDSFLKKHHLDCWNHLMGLIGGLVLAIATTWFFTYGMMYFVTSSRPMVAQSRSAKYLLRLAEVGKKTLPGDSDVEVKETKTFYQMSETFIQRVQAEQSENPGDVKSEQNTGIPRFLDDVDSKLKLILKPEPEEVP